VHLHRRANAGPGQRQRKRRLVLSSHRDGLLRSPGATPAWHTLNIDFANPAEGPSARVAVELTAQSALALVDAIRAALAAVPPELTTESPAAAR
jgi:hypothetical protein